MKKESLPKNILQKSSRKPFSTICITQNKVFYSTKSLYMKIKNLILVFFALLIITGCAKSRPELTAQEYNNKIISFQIQAVDAVNEYFTTLEKKYDGQNLAELYI